MPVGEPYIPETITVHLGRPEESAYNVTVPFPDYIKNPHGQRTPCVPTSTSLPPLP